jgi:hypothetical protein
MAKAVDKTSTNDEIWFHDAVTQLAERGGEHADWAEQLLVKGLEDGLVPWSHMKDRIRVKGDAVFWRQLQVDPFLKINRAENSAKYGAPIEAPHSDVPGAVKGIKVSRRAALALLPSASPAESSAPLGPISNAELSLSQAAKRKKRGKAQQLIGEAAKELYPPKGMVPLDITPGDLKKAVEDLLDLKARERSEAIGKKENPPLFQRGPLTSGSWSPSAVPDAPPTPVRRLRLVGRSTRHVDRCRRHVDRCRFFPQLARVRCCARHGETIRNRSPSKS